MGSQVDLQGFFWWQIQFIYIFIQVLPLHPLAYGLPLPNPWLLFLPHVSYLYPQKTANLLQKVENLLRKTANSHYTSGGS